MARVGSPYVYIVTTNAISGDTVTVTPDSTPAGMIYNSTTQSFTWTPTAAQASASQSFSATVTDALGNTAPIGPVSITVSTTAAPAAPASIQVQPPSGLGTASLTSANNSSASTALAFLVSGVAAGDTVNVYVDGGIVPIATGTVAPGAASVTVTSNGTSPLADGSHQFVARQSDGISEGASSSAATVQVFTALSVTMTSPFTASATVGQTFSYQYALASNAPAGDAVTYSLAPGRPTE